MDLAIKVVDADGKSFVEDLDGELMYFMGHRGEELRPTVQDDFLLENFKGEHVPLCLYHKTRFDTLEDARRFICQVSLSYEIEKLEGMQQTPEIAGSLALAQEELRRYKE
jgi:hypothetical protein